MHHAAALNDADLIVLCSAFQELAEFRMIKLLIIVLWNLHISVIVLMLDRQPGQRIKLSRIFMPPRADGPLQGLPPGPPSTPH